MSPKKRAKAPPPLTPHPTEEMVSVAPSSMLSNSRSVLDAGEMESVSSPYGVQRGGEGSSVEAREFSGRVQVAIRVRPLLPQELERGEELCVGVFRADNSVAQKQLTSPERIAVWNQSKRGQNEIVGGAGMTLRLMRRPAVRDVGTAAAVQFPSSQKTAAESWWSQHLQANSSSCSTGNGSHTIKDFFFPIVLGQGASQEATYKSLHIDRYCDAAFEGKAAAVLCFGQTGSGKTFTVSGRTEEVQESEGAHPMSSADREDGAVGPALKERLVAEDGLQYRAISYFMGERLRSMQKSGLRVHVQASYIELYNERVNDLLQGRENLKLRYHPAAQMFFLEGLMMVECESEDDVLMVLREGQQHRQRAAHLLNEDSSRSHTIFTLYVEVGGAAGGARNSAAHQAVLLGFDDDVDGSVAAATHSVHGKLSFVDLAGAERLKETGSGGSDTKSINKSLFALGTVIEKLSQQQRDAAAGRRANPSSTSFIPYRSSALTQLLMDSLSGNCELLFIACVTPSTRFYEESIKTLYYAQRSSDIAAAPTTRLQHDEAKSYRVEEKLRQLQEENRIFREVLRLPLRGALGAEDIHRQMHHLLQQRGSGDGEHVVFREGPLKSVLQPRARQAAAGYRSSSRNAYPEPAAQCPILLHQRHLNRSRAPPPPPAKRAMSFGSDPADQPLARRRPSPLPRRSVPLLLAPAPQLRPPSYSNASHLLPPKPHTSDAVARPSRLQALSSAPPDRNGSAVSGRGGSEPGLPSRVCALPNPQQTEAPAAEPAKMAGAGASPLASRHQGGAVVSAPAFKGMSALDILCQLPDSSSLVK